MEVHGHSHCFTRCTPNVVANILDEVVKIKSQIEMLQGDLKDHINIQVDKFNGKVMETVICTFSVASNVKQKENGLHSCNTGHTDDKYDCTKGCAQEAPYIDIESDSIKDKKDELMIDDIDDTKISSSIINIYEEYIVTGGKVVGPFQLSSCIDFFLVYLSSSCFQYKFINDVSL